MKKIKLITESPFVKTVSDGEVHWMFAVKNSTDGEVFKASIDPRSLMKTLGEKHGGGKWQDELLTCSCGEPACAGLYDEKFETSDEYVHWEFDYYKCSLDKKCRKISWYFDRHVYETGAIDMLKEVYATKTGWEFYAHCYETYEEFKAAVDKFLTEKPRYKAMWDGL